MQTFLRVRHAIIPGEECLFCVTNPKRVFANLILQEQDRRLNQSRKWTSLYSELFEDYHIFKRTELEETPEKTAESVDVDRILDGEPKIEWFMQQKEKSYQLLSPRFNDLLFEEQCCLKRPQNPTFNITSVWPAFTGRGILVAVVDNGVDGNHPELSSNYMEEDMSKERTIREARHNRVLNEDKSGWHVIVKLPNGERISRYIKKESCYQAVYDWVGYPDGRPLFFTLHGGGGVKKLEDPVEGHCFLHLHEREEEEMLLLLDSEVSLRGSLPKGTEDLSSTLPDERKDDDAMRGVGPPEAKRPKGEAGVTEKGENNENTKKKRRRRKKSKNVVGNDGNE